MADTMTPEEARSYLNYLLTLGIRREQAFAPLAAAFIRENDLDALGLLPDEQVSLLLAAAQSFAPEPRRYSAKLDFLQRAQALLPRTRLAGTPVEGQVGQELRKTAYELDRYHEAVRVNRSGTEERERIIIESMAPEYFTNIAQRRAAAHYQEHYHLTPEARRAQSYTGPAQNFEPDNTAIHKEFEGACGPFMNARTHAFHVLLPFDLKLSRTPQDPLETGVRIFYGKSGYSFPLRYQMGQLTSDRDGTVAGVPVDDPNLMYVSASRVKEPPGAKPRTVSLSGSCKVTVSKCACAPCARSRRTIATTRSNSSPLKGSSGWAERSRRGNSSLARTWAMAKLLRCGNSSATLPEGHGAHLDALARAPLRRESRDPRMRSAKVMA